MWQVSFFWRRGAGGLVNDDVTLEEGHQIITLDYEGRGQSKIDQILIT